ncbi:MAG: TldD/PmbA family protein [Firmicutes bacterium]|nr:TldD/PmbA family protein [Bacillota bacterium]
MNLAGDALKNGTDPGALIERARSLGASQAEVYTLERVVDPVAFEANRLRRVSSTQTGAVAVRVVKDGRLGQASSTRPGDTEVVDMAVRAAELGPPADFDFAPAAPVRGDLQMFDPAVPEWDVEAMVEAGRGLVEQVHGLADGLQVQIRLDKTETVTRVVTSAGQDVSRRGTLTQLSYSLELVEPENMIHVFYYDRSRRLGLDLGRAVRRVTELFTHARRNVRAGTGSFRVLFAPCAVADLVAPLVSCLDGKAVAKGESPWRDKLGQKLFAEDFTVWDDPTVPWEPRTVPVDDEGVPTTRRAVIERGVLKGFFLDLRSARALGQSGGGNGFRRGPDAPPAPSPTNLVLEPGTRPADELLSELSDGLYVVQLMGAWAGNPYAGQVSGNVLLGYLVRGGEIVGRVKDCMVSVNVFEAFAGALVARSREMEPTMGAERLPYLLLDGVSVTAKG